MQAVGAALPEFDGDWVEDESAPMIGHGHRFNWKLCGDGLHTTLELSAAGEQGGLRANPGGEPAAAGAGIEIGEGFLLRQWKDRTSSTHLTLERFPMEADGCVRIGCQFATLAASELGEELEAPRVQPFEKHRANGGLASRIHCGEGHGGRFRVICLEGELKPALELGQRISEQIASA